MTFQQVLHESLATWPLVEQFDRLFGASLTERKAPLDAMIDDATGRSRDDVGRFIWFVWEFVWTRLPPEAREPDPLEAFWAHVAAKHQPAEWGRELARE